jgi:hypothetical protein
MREITRGNGVGKPRQIAQRLLDETAGFAGRQTVPEAGQFAGIAAF